MSVTLYGIPSCDTMKKARAWLDAHGIAYDFHDYRKMGADPATIAQWVAQAGIDRVLNKAGTTYRKLPEAARAGIDPGRAIELMAAHPSCIKRPIVAHAGGLLVGFQADEWAAVLG